MAQKPAGDEAEADQTEEGQREVENLGEPRFHPPGKEQYGECGGRAEKWREPGKTGQTVPRLHFRPPRQHGRFAALEAREADSRSKNAYSLGNL
jgi:hypothetical protein